MRSRPILALTLALTLVSMAPVAASDANDRLLEGLAIDLEALIGAMEGVDLGQVTVKKYRSGITMLSIPLPEADVERLRAAAASSGAAKDFAAMAVGIQLTDPSSFSTLIIAVDALPSTEYNVWCAVANLRETTQTKKVTIQMKGSFKVSDTLDFDPFSLHLPLTTGTTPDFGITQLSCKVTGGGKAKAKVIPN